MSRSKNILEWLIARQIISADQAESVSKLRDEQGGTVEQIMLELGVLSEEDLIALYADAYQLRYLRLEDVEIDPEAARHIPARIAHKFAMVPIRRTGNVLAVVMADPLDQEALAEARKTTDFDIVPFAGRIDAIEHAIFLHYGEPKLSVDQESTAPSIPASIRSKMLGGDDRIGHMAKSIRLNQEWDWDKFVTCPANEHAVALVKRVSCAVGGEGANLSIIAGDAGCGKSHLLHAAAHYVSSQNPLCRMMLTTADRFCSHVFESVRDGKLNLLRYLYRELDLLLFDNLDELWSRDWAQQELAETLQTILRKGKMVCLTTHGDWSTSARVIPSLRAVLETGAQTEIGAYNEKARIEILLKRAGPVSLPAEVLNYLARHGGGTISDMLSVLQPLIVMAAQTEEKLTTDLVSEMIHLRGALDEVTATASESSTPSRRPQSNRRKSKETNHE